MYCDFEPTGEVFKNKKIYRCKLCNLTLALENKDAKILCFNYSRALFRQELIDTNSGTTLPEKDIVAQDEKMLNEVLTQAKDAAIKKQEDNQEDLLCSQDEIEQRLGICFKCEHYKDNACMLCGCRIVRGKNHKNKLANKKASCPDNRWGPIN